MTITKKEDLDSVKIQRDLNLVQYDINPDSKYSNSHTEFQPLSHAILQDLSSQETKPNSILGKSLPNFGASTEPNVNQFKTDSVDSVKNENKVDEEINSKEKLDSTEQEIIQDPIEEYKIEKQKEIDILKSDYEKRISEYEEKIKSLEDEFEKYKNFGQDIESKYVEFLETQNKKISDHYIPIIAHIITKLFNTNESVTKEISQTIFEYLQFSKEPNLEIKITCNTEKIGENIQNLCNQLSLQNMTIEDNPTLENFEYLISFGDIQIKNLNTDEIENKIMELLKH